jgi:hypothetical protein
VKRPWVLLGVLAVLIVAGAVLAGPSGSDDRGPHGTLALRRYLEAVGGTVRTAGPTPRRMARRSASSSTIPA